MKKAELFKILSDPNCDSKYIELALRRYSPNEVLKIPAISLRSLHTDFPRSKIINFWFSLLTPDFVFHSSNIPTPHNLGFYLVAFYSKHDRTFFSYMALICNKALLKKLLPKFRDMLDKTNSVVSKYIAFPLYAYNLISKQELIDILNASTDSWHRTIGVPASHAFPRCEKLLERILSLNEDVNSAAHFLALETLNSYFFSRQMMDIAHFVVTKHNHKWDLFMDLYYKHLKSYRN
jgi:hypothetical protein